MAVFITKKEIEEMKKKVIDKETGMTEYDLFENQHCYEDIIVCNAIVTEKGDK